VSVGEEKVLQYPEQSVTLSAFALPAAAPGETYTYSWSLLAHPEGENIGNMQGTNEKQLHLAQVSYHEF